MADEKVRKTREQVLQEIAENHNRRHAQAGRLLVNINEHRADIERLLAVYKKEEPDLVYRFYHQSYKVFIMVELTRQVVNLFHRLAPDSAKLNDWYALITTEALSKEFDPDKTNSIWLAETLPVLQGYWHSKYFLEQMLVAAEELDEAPEILPSGWAAVLYLYNLR